MAAKLTIKRLLARFENDERLSSVLKEINEAMEQGTLADLMVVMMHKGADNAYTVAHTFEDTVKAIGLLEVAQHDLLSGEDE